MFKKLILAALVVTSAVFAQVNVGGRAAFNFGTFWGDDAEDVTWGAGFNAGVNAKILINPMLSFVPGLEVDYRRISDEATDEYMGRTQTDEMTLSMWYLEIPALLRINVTPQFFIDAGLTIAFNLADNQHTETTKEYQGRKETVSSDRDFSDGVETVELGLVVGAGYAVNQNLDINARFGLGLTKVGKGGDVKNMRFQAGVTYWFM